MYQHSDMEAKFHPWRAAWAFLLATACFGLQSAGCRPQNSGAPPRLPEPAEAALPAVPVAKLRSATLAELRHAVRKMFGARPFETGQTLEDLPDAGAVDITTDMPGEIALAFKHARLEGALSPVIAHEARSGVVRYLQLGPVGDDKVSLVAGREKGNDKAPSDKIFRIEERWVTRLVEWDTCGRAVAGDTQVASACGYDGCPIRLTRQLFIHPSGELEPLLFELHDDEAEDVVQKHLTNHVRTSKHCNQVTDAAGKCTLDCAQTAK